MADDKKPSTRSLIADAEALRSGGASKKSPKTKQLVAESERLIGREPPKSSRGIIMAAGFAVALLVVAVVIWRFVLSGA